VLAVVLPRSSVRGVVWRSGPIKGNTGGHR
jgi:hypothetical protein